MVHEEIKCSSFENKKINIYIKIFHVNLQIAYRYMCICKSFFAKYLCNSNEFINMFACETCSLQQYSALQRRQQFLALQNM